MRQVGFKVSWEKEEEALMIKYVIVVGILRYLNICSSTPCEMLDGPRCGV